MIELTIGSLEEKIIRLLQKNYPITTFEIAQKLRVTRNEIEWVLRKFQMKGIVRLDQLPDVTYVRLLRNDFLFHGLKQQRKTLKRTSEGKKQDYENHDDIMYS